jgi:hypothetical protein
MSGPTNIYRSALQVQDACNLSGVAHSLSRDVLPAVWAEAHAAGQGTEYVNTHPAVVLFVDKLASLAHVQGITDSSMQAYSNAARTCEERAEVAVKP